MIAVALFYDAVTLFVPTIVAPVAGIHFWMWFKFKGISFISPKKLGVVGGSALAELFPFTSWLPAWTFAVYMVAKDFVKKPEAGI